jgi:hypothetical protein
MLDADALVMDRQVLRHEPAMAMGRLLFAAE